MEDDRADLLYFESQTAALCGIHAVNTLLQAPHFSEVEMAQIAHELDAAEHALMSSNGLESAEYLQYVAEGSGNVAESGMFSIQVLSRALEVFGLQAVPLSSPDAADAHAEPTSQQAFLCNLEDHWLTVRRIHDQWWNLNSLYPAPEPLSTFYLSAFLGSLQEQGYTIFVIRGQLPPSQPPASLEERAIPGQAGRWFTPEEARAATQERERLKKQGYVQAAVQGVLGKVSGGQGTWLTLRRPGAKRALDEGSDGDGGDQGDDPDLAAALAASLDQAEGGSRGYAGALGAAVAEADEDSDLAAAIAASLADQQPSGSQQQQQQQQAPPSQASPRSVAADALHGLDEEDSDLAAVIAASLQPVLAQQAPAQQQQEQEQAQQGLEDQQKAEAAATPGAAQPPELEPEPEASAEGAIEVALRLPGSGGRVSRRFDASGDTVGHLAALAAQHGADMAACQLALQFPRRVLSDWKQSLEEAGVGDKQLVAVEPK